MRILVITYYWPPSGGSGVQRWLKFVKYLSRLGHHVEVVTPLNPAFDVKDESLKKDIPEDLIVHKLPIWEPHKLIKKTKGGANSSGNLGGNKSSFLAKVFRWFRGNVFIPDSRVFWVRKARKFLKGYLKKNQFDAVITTGPPHSMHLIPLPLKKKFNFRWIADFRDTWSQIDFLDEFYTSKLSRKIHESLEQKVLNNADKVVTINEKTGELLEKLTTKKIDLIYNGFDPEDINKPYKTSKENDYFTISHFGLMNKFRDPENLLIALEELCDENQKFKEKLRIKFGGVIEEDIITRIKASSNLRDKLDYEGYVSHEKVIETYFESDILLLLLNNTPLGKTIMTGKIYEYLAIGKPILGLGFIDSDPALLINQVKAGSFYEYSDKEGMKKFIIQLFKKQLFFDRDQGEIEQFSRAKNAEKLVKLIKQPER